MARYSGRSAGEFGELGGELIFDWIPDLDVVATELLEVAGYLENIEKPLLLSRSILQHDIRMRFETKTDPDGNPWAEWSEGYAKWRENNSPGGGILHLTGELESVATGEGAFVVGEAGIFFNTAGLPEYWIWHQEGRTRNTRSAGQGLSDEEITHMAATLRISEESIREMHAGSNELPARPFVGASFEAEIEIVEVFDKWFDGAIALATSSKGKVFARHAYRGPGGRFAKRP